MHFLLLLPLHTVFCSSLEGPTEKFYNTILSNYSVDVPAWDRTGEELLLQFSVPFIVLGQMDETTQLTSYIAKVQVSWVDPRLKFDPDELGASWLLIPSSKIWIPQFEVYNSMIVDQGDKPQPYDQVKITSNGTVLIMWKARFDVICQLTMVNYPFDIQWCGISFSCGLSPAEQMQAVSTVSSKDFLVGTLEWQLLPPTAINYFFADDVRNQSLSSLRYPLKRNPEFYIYFLILPTFIITTTCVTALLFPMNIEIAERINLGLAGLLGLTFMLSVIIQELPRSSAIPLMGKWLIIQMFFCITSMFAHFPGTLIRRRYPKHPERVTLFNVIVLSVVLLAHCLTSILIFVFRPAEEDPSIWQTL